MDATGYRTDAKGYCADAIGYAPRQHSPARSLSPAVCAPITRRPLTHVHQSRAAPSLTRTNHASPPHSRAPITRRPLTHHLANQPMWTARWSEHPYAEKGPTTLNREGDLGRDSSCTSFNETIKSKSVQYTNRISRDRVRMFSLGFCRRELSAF
eukprot:1402877-Pyramimonas_sp.AAC.1